VRIETSTATGLGCKVTTSGMIALDRVVGFSSEVSAGLLTPERNRVGRNRALSHVALAIATKTSKSHLTGWLLKAGGRTSTTCGWLWDRGWRVRWGGNSSVAARDWDRGR
jgi:hypothetical protein